MAVFVLNVKIFVLNVKIAVVYDIAGSQQIGCWISWLCQVTIEFEFQNLICCPLFLVIRVVSACDGTA